MTHERTGKQQLWKSSDGALTEKESEVTGTWDMPLQGAPSRTNPTEKPKPLSTIPKVGSLQELFGWEEKMASVQPTVDDELETMFKQASDEHRERQGNEPDTNLSMSHPEQPSCLPQCKKVLSPHVDVSGKEPPKLVQKKEAQYHAMPSLRQYPLDGFHQVKAASAYFDQYWKEMPGEDRREFASNLVKRASMLGMPVSETAEHYGAPGYAPRVHTLTELAAREDLVKEAAHQDLYVQLKDQLGVLPPDVFARTLHEVDKLAGIDEAYDRDCMDPWFTTFGTEKTAKPSVSPEDTVVIGAEYMTVPALVQFAESRQAMMKARFGDELAEEFSKDPTGVFNSLPRDQKIVVMRMVNNSKSMLDGATTS